MIPSLLPRLGKRSRVNILSMDKPGNTKGGKYHCTIDLLFDWFGISCMTTDNFCFYFQNRLIQTSQTGGQQYSDSSPFSIPWTNPLAYFVEENIESIFKQKCELEKKGFMTLIPGAP
jgi:hypothetical protein